MGYSAHATGVSNDVSSVARHCTACDRVHAAYCSTKRGTHQQSFLQLGLDVCGPFETTARGHKYTIVAVKNVFKILWKIHFLKYTLLMPLTDKHAVQTSFAFEHHILGRYRACADVVTDQGTVRPAPGHICEVCRFRDGWE